MSQSKCLKCDTQVDEYWFTFGLPGAYCTECIDSVVEEHEYLSRLLDLFMDNLKKEFVKVHNGPTKTG